MLKMRLLRVLRLFAISKRFNSTSVKSVAVLGGGPSGAGAAKALFHENYFDKIKVFEKRSLFGGLWNYTEETDNSTTPIPCENANFDITPVLKNQGEYVWPAPVYDFLDTNVPKDIMTYADFPFPSHLPLFPHGSDVLKYMCEYAESIRHLVSFNTKVVHVEYQLDLGKWQVISRPVIIETDGGSVPSEKFADTTEYFDAVILAIGNYDIPYIPNRIGMEQWSKKYPNSIMHVKSYRNPNQFKDAKGNILIVGNSASGGDLAFQLTTHLNRTIYKLKRSENLLPAGENDLIVDLPDIEKFNYENKLITFKDGSVLENVDYILFATGYLKSFPFLKLDSSKPPILTDGHKLHGIYEHVILYNYPNLAIVGVPRFVLPTRTSESQGIWISKVWSDKIKLPLKQEMIDLELKRIEVKGSGKQFHDLTFPEDVEYSNRLNNQILASVEGLNHKGLIPKIWDKEQTALKASIKNIKEAYIRYRVQTGKNASNYQELIDAKVIDELLIDDEELASYGFKFK